MGHQRDLREVAPTGDGRHWFSVHQGPPVGKPLPGQELRLSPDGEVLVRGANVTPGILDHGEVRTATDAEGWLHTGDLGELDERGRLRITGRSKDVIVTPEGLNVHASDVERALAPITHREIRTWRRSVRLQMGSRRFLRKSWLFLPAAPLT